MAKAKKTSFSEEIENYPEPTEEDYINDYKEYFEIAINLPEYSTNACMFISSTKVNKFDLTYEIMKTHGLKEWDGKQGDFVFIDSMQNSTYESALELVDKFKDLKFVIVTNCSNIFHNDDLVLLYKIINDGDRTVDWYGERPKYKTKVNAYYVFLCDCDITADLENPEKGESFVFCTQQINGQINFP